MADPKPGALPPLVTYNGFTFMFAAMQTNDRVLYGDDETTQVGVEQTFTFSGRLIEETVDKLITAMARAKAALWEPGKRLQVLIGDNVPTEALIDISGDTANAASGATIDIAYGPKPQTVDVGRINNYSARIEFSIIATIKVCPGSRSKIRSHTSSWAYSVDMAHYTTRTITGSLSVFAPNNINDYRPQTILSAPKGYKPISHSFIADNTNLNATYIQIDKQVARPLPSPFVGGEAEFTIVKGANGITVATYSGFFLGPYTKKERIQPYKKIIMTRIFTMVDGYFNLPANSAKIVWLERSITEIIYNNQIRFSFTARLNAAVTFGLQMPGIQQIGITFPDETGTSRPFRDLSGIAKPGFKTYDACGESDKTKKDEGTASTSASASAASGGSSSRGQTEKSSFPLEVYQLVKYVTDYKTSIWTPKDPKVPKVAIQTSRPDITVLQSGFIKQGGSVPALPKPLYEAPHGYLQWKDTDLEESKNAGQKIYTLNYDYQIVLRDNSKQKKYGGVASVNIPSTSKAKTEIKDPAVTTKVDVAPTAAPTTEKADFWVFQNGEWVLTQR